MAKKKKKQKRIREPVSVNLGATEIESLDRLVKITGTNRSEVIRILIPSPGEIIAAEEIAIWTRQQVSKLEPLGSLASTKISVMVGYRFAFSNFLAKSLRGIDLQLQAVTENAENRYKALVRLFVTWIRAKNHVQGYRFVEVEIDTSILGDKKKPCLIKYNAVLAPPEGFKFKNYVLLRNGMSVNEGTYEDACEKQRKNCQQMMQESYDRYASNPGDYLKRNRPYFWDEVAD